MSIRNIIYSLFLTWSVWLAVAAAITQTLGGALNCHAQTYFANCSQLLMMGSQGIADPYTHMYAYPQDSARQARGWIWLEAWPRLQAFLLPYP
jgi:hypothetical protein